MLLIGGVAMVLILVFGEDMRIEGQALWVYAETPWS